MVALRSLLGPLWICIAVNPIGAQPSPEPGHSIGTISTRGKLIVMELDRDVLGHANLFNLDHRTLRFTPEGGGYRISNLPLKWDSEFGPELKGNEVILHNFVFPFSGKQWRSFSAVGTGAVIFGSIPQAPPRAATGFTIARFDQLANAATAIVNTVPGIAVFLKPRLSGSRYEKELSDRVVITWDLTEPWGGIQDFTWKPTVNRFQLMLAKDGSIEMSYNGVAARDAIVGLYPTREKGTEMPLTNLRAQSSSPEAPYLDLTSIKISIVDAMFLKVTFETHGPVLPEGDPELPGLIYRVYFERQSGASDRGCRSGASCVTWTIRGVGGRRGSRYVSFGRGLTGKVTVSGNSLSVQGILPAEFINARRILVAADVASAQGAVVAKVQPQTVSLSGLLSPEVHLASLTPHDGPFSIVFEAFHYLALPNPRDLSCTVIQALGDKFDFLAYYSDFRIDNQEAGTPSNGPMGGHVTGIGQTEKDVSAYCSAGRFQWGFIQPVYVGANQMQEFPPPGVRTNNPRDIDFYEHQLEERSPGQKITPYDLAMSQIGHEMGHRWSAFVSAKINGEVVPLGPTHWARGLQAPAAFPYQRPVEASAMGGGVWQDNFDGTFTQLDDDYYVPATGYSYLDLYLMGLIAPTEVPDFFLLRNLTPVGHDANGHPIFRADRVKVTINDVISVEGPRLPDVYHSQRKFNTGIVVMVEHGNRPSPELLERANGIANAWIDYWGTVTNHRASMTVNPLGDF